MKVIGTHCITIILCILCHNSFCCDSSIVDAIDGLKELQDRVGQPMFNECLINLVSKEVELSLREVRKSDGRQYRRHMLLNKRRETSSSISVDRSWSIE